MTIPLILQIQQAAFDSNSSVTDALRKAKVACAKLGLAEFGDWVGLELNGYVDKPRTEVPNYRKLWGFPEVLNPYSGDWQSINFKKPELANLLSTAYLNMSMLEIEQSLLGKTNEGFFEFPYSPEQAALLRQWMSLDTATFRIKLGIPQVANIPNTVRNIILDWAIDMEKKGILGGDLMFNEEERAKSTEATAPTVTNIHIAQVGSFVQHAEKSIVQGGVDAVLNLDRVQQFVEQVEQLLSAADVPKSVKEDTEAALSEVKQATAHPRESGKLRAALQRVGQAVAPAGEHLLRIAVDAGVSRLLSGG